MKYERYLLQIAEYDPDADDFITIGVSLLPIAFPDREYRQARESGADKVFSSARIHQELLDATDKKFEYKTFIKGRLVEEVIRATYHPPSSCGESSSGTCQTASEPGISIQQSDPS